VDLKIAGYEEQVVGCLAEHGVLDSALVCSLIPESLRRVRSLAPEAFIAISYPEDTGGASTKPYLKHVVSAALMVMRATLPWRIGRMMRYAQADGAMLYHKLLTPALVAAVHRQGGWLGTWTVDRPEDIARAHTLGVDSITSNRPDLL
jgi:glycerophosphoryl diester phosphodiesterase